MISILHAACGFLALALGLVVILNNKGTRFHRRLGQTYWLVMLVLNITAFGIYRLNGHFNIFHIFAHRKPGNDFGGTDSCFASQTHPQLA
jgi:uncharacterized membrane protein